MVEWQCINYNNSNLRQLTESSFIIMAAGKHKHVSKGKEKRHTLYITIIEIMNYLKEGDLCFSLQQNVEFSSGSPLLENNGPR